MGTTSTFMKLRSTGTPKTGEWNKNYAKALELAKKNGKYIVTCWTNGDICGYCVTAEKCMMESAFKNWIKTADAYFVVQHSGDSDNGKALYDWIYTNGRLHLYPGFRITLYDAGGMIVSDKVITGNDLRKSKTGATGAKNMAKALQEIIENNPLDKAASDVDYKIRLNESLTVKKVNAILDAIDKAGGYCPCQAGKTADTKCHCKDFKENKKIGEPCICNIYVKKAK